MEPDDVKLYSAIRQIGIVHILEKVTAAIRPACAKTTASHMK
jgi:hypothetical protein